MELLQRQRLIQEQRLSPEQVLYYELLQKPLIELEAAIEEELRSNPALEKEEVLRCPRCGEIMERGESCTTCRPGQADKADRKEDELSEGTLDFMDDIYNSNESMYEASYYEKSSEDEEGRDKFARAIRPFTISDHLKAGLPYIPHDFTPEERVVMDDLVAMVDSNGFLPQDDETIAIENGTTVGIIAKLRGVISSIEPVGAGLRNPTECMLKQLDYISTQDNRDVDTEREIVQHYLKEAAQERFAKIAKKIGVSTKVVRAAFEFIKEKLYYSPAAQLSLEGKLEPAQNIYIEPEVRIYDEGGELIVELIETGMPHLKISRFYSEAYTKMKDGGSKEFTSDERKHIREHLYKAKKFIEHIHTRRDTILRIVIWLVDYQKDFIRNGPASLKPLTRERVANEVGFHPSTVTRALRNRYVQFPDNSVRDFAVFFDSSSSVIAEILNILKEETPEKVFSDEEITERLKSMGNDLSRRAITKYRHIAKIPSSGLRKRALKEKAKETPPPEPNPEEL